MILQNTDIVEFLKEELTRPFVYVPNSGNAGDALMASATYDIFDKLAVDYISVPHKSLYSPENIAGQILVLAGGGNFNETGYNAYADLLLRLQDLAAKIIVLPHTINGNNHLLSQLGGNITLICRETVSFEHTRKYAAGARILLAHDMAFKLDVAAALNYKPRYIRSLFKKLSAALIDRSASHSYPRLRDYKNGILQTIAQYKPRRRHERVAHLFRGDIESTGIPIPPDNIDASEVFNYGVTSALKARYTVYHLLKFLRDWNVIHTNRLHIGIASALLGKEVHLYSNNYYKCRAVYEHSIRDHFANVIWHD